MTHFRNSIVRVASVALVLLSTSLLLLSSGCSNRGTNTPLYVTEEWGLVPGVGSNHIFDFPGLYFQPQNPTGLQLMTAYLPKVSFPAPLGTNRKVPLLVLLAPSFGSQNFYFNSGGLFELAQEMTLSGEIEPMAIVCLANNHAFGGFFYGKSIVGGDYDSVLSQQFIDAMINFKGYNIRPERSKHGIGGVGMGAYGAYRQGMINSNVWGSVSGVDGPLDFDGSDGVSGFLPLFDSVVAEFPGDPNTFYKRFDTSSLSPIRSLIVSGALAFSAVDTAQTVPTNLFDSTVVVAVAPRFRKFLKVRNRLVPSSTDSTTLVDSFFRPTGFTDTLVNYTYVLEGRPFMNFFLPFLPNGDPYPQVWNRWMTNDLDAIRQRLGSPLSSTQMFLGSSDNARFGFGNMTRSWAATVSSAYPGQVQTYEYGGYQGNPATEKQYTYDLLRKMLLFHNEAFKD